MVLKKKKSILPVHHNALGYLHEYGAHINPLWEKKNIMYLHYLECLETNTLQYEFILHIIVLFLVGQVCFGFFKCFSFLGLQISITNMLI